MTKDRLLLILFLVAFQCYLVIMPQLKRRGRTAPELVQTPVTLPQ
jgi:hypothetical protein